MDDLIAFLRARLDEDAAAAHEWPEDQHRWEARGSRQLYYASGSGESVTAISVGGDGPLGWERITVKRDGIGLAEHIARHDPARVLAEVEAKRRMIDLCAPPLVDVTWPGDVARQYIPGQGEPWGADVLRLLALPYADHPDYRDTWRP